MAGVYSVGQINQYIRNMFNQDFLLKKVSVKAEVSNCKYHSSGHIYFTLKDETGTLAAVMFAGNRSGLLFKMQDGMKVTVTGSVSVYERDGKYQLYATKIEQEGAGDLFLKFNQLKEELEEMGMFAPEYKKPIPKYARKIGIVTAATGAAVRDIINITSRRNPYVQLVLYSAVVQGEYAVPSIVKGLKCLDAYGVDVIIVGRGGGSIEDLWAFNEREVARAIFDCETPVISAVGHETDFTIADFVSDMRAPTPSAAAEIAVFDYDEFADKLNRYRDSLLYCIKNNLQVYYDKINEYLVHFKYLNPIYVLNENIQRVADYSDVLNRCINDKLNINRQRLAIMVEKLEGVSPLNRIKSGYAFVENIDGTAVKNIDSVSENDIININVIDGVIEAKVVSKEKRLLS